MSMLIWEGVLPVERTVDDVATIDMFSKIKKKNLYQHMVH